MKRVILTTGGTGGHIFPALAVAEELKKRNPSAMLLFMGGEYGPEADLAAKAGMDFVGLPVRGIMGRGMRGLTAGVSMIRAVGKAMGIMRKVKPQMVVGFGGYAAVAGVLAGRLNRSLSAVHEQNAFPGMANRALSRIVDRVYLSMPDDAGAFPRSKCLLTGNPSRAAIAALHADALHRVAAKTELDTEAHEGQSRHVLIMGGSLGAKAINDALIANIDTLLNAGLTIRHQTGKADYERVRDAYRQCGADHVQVEAFISDMPEAYAWADMIVCRAGASTLAEIACAGLPALLVPFPHAAQDHQRHNARSLEKAGAAVLLEQEKLAARGEFVHYVLSLVNDAARLRAMAAKSLAQAKPDAALTLVDDMERLWARRRL